MSIKRLNDDQGHHEIRLIVFIRLLTKIVKYFKFFLKILFFFTNLRRSKFILCKNNMLVSFLKMCSLGTKLFYVCLRNCINFSTGKLIMAPLTMVLTIPPIWSKMSVLYSLNSSFWFSFKKLFTVSPLNCWWEKGNH